MSLLEGYRLFTGYYIYESESLPSEGKLEFIRFLKEATADDIIDILSGQYEGIEGLTEEEMEAVNSFLEEKFKVPKVPASVKKKAGEAGSWIAKKSKGPRGYVSKKLGWAKAGAEKAKLKAMKGAPKKGESLVKKGEAYAKQKKAVRKAYAGAIGRTAQS